MKKLTVLFMVITLAFSSSAQQIDSLVAANLQQALDLWLIYHPIKGASAALITKEGNVWQGATGVSHGNTPITPQTLFGMASCTKTYVASIIMQLYQEDSLELSDPLHYYLPAFPNIDSDITITQLLNHTSGIYDFVDHPNFMPAMFANGTKWWTPEEVLSSMVNAPYFTPGAGYHYSNTGYLLLGMIIEEITGNSFSHELEQRLLIPNNLDSTFFWPWMPYPYYPSHWWFELQGVMTDISGMSDTASYTCSFTAGANLSTPLDLAKWIKALMEGQVVEDSTLALMMAPMSYPFYGLGISAHSNSYTYNWCFGHTGNLVHKTAAFYVPADSLTLVVMHNTDPGLATPLWDELYTVLKTSVGMEVLPTQPCRVFPNPTSGLLGIRAPKDERIERVEIFTLQGQKLMEEEDLPSGGSLDLRSWDRGVYLARIHTVNSVTPVRIILQ